MICHGDEVRAFAERSTLTPGTGGISMTRRHVHAALGLLPLALLGGCAAPGPAPEARKAVS